MSAKRDYRVLVVDDEVPIRRLTMRALNQAGMRCDEAEDGLQAEQMLARTRYDAVVTDLRMPQRHGHALAVDLLAREPRPLVFVQTGVLEPRMARDLFARGVDDVMFKPLDYGLLAVKLRTLLNRRDSGLPQGQQSKTQATSPPAAPEDLGPIERVSLSELESKLIRFAQTSPISQAAVKVFNLAYSEDCSACDLAAALRCEASLTMEVLRLANSSFYNPLGRKIVELEEAIARIGQKRIGEMALATNALAALTATALPWMDVGAVWRTSVAAGIALERLAAHQPPTLRDEGLYLSALMQGLGRVVLGTLYPERYEKMVRRCLRLHGPLCEHEKQVFPENHAEVMARLLALWKLPSSIFHPLKYSQDGYAYLARLAEPLRSRVELVKLATLVAQFAVGQWEGWDLVEPPLGSVLTRLRIDSIGAVLDLTRLELARITDSNAVSSDQAQRSPPGPPPLPARPCPYVNLSEEPFDFLGEILPSMGIQPRHCGDDVPLTDRLLINCTAIDAQRAGRFFEGQATERMSCVAAKADEAHLGCCRGRMIVLPTSYGALRAASWEVVQTAN